VLKWRRALYRDLSFTWHKLHSYRCVGGRNKLDGNIVAVDCIVCLWLENLKGWLYERQLIVEAFGMNDRARPTFPSEEVK
jgi:hypothetical protein